MGLDDPTAEPPPADELLNSYSVVYHDFDKGPTRSWMIHNRAEPEVAPLYELAFGKRPLEELYDLRSDPDYMANLATDPAYETTREQLHDQLVQILKEQNDPRVTESPPRFELPPYAGPLSEEWKQENASVPRPNYRK